MAEAELPLGSTGPRACGILCCRDGGESTGGEDSGDHNVVKVVLVNACASIMSWPSSAAKEREASQEGVAISELSSGQSVDGRADRLKLS